jgi:hypothetical protein
MAAASAGWDLLHVPLYLAAAAYLMLTILALVIIFDTGPRRFQLALAVVAVAQFALALAWAPSSTNFAVWAHLVF